MLTIDNLKQIYMNKNNIDCKNTITTFINLDHKIEQIKDYEDNIDLITCPITQDIIQNPIKLNGKYYEKDYIENWIKNNKRDPLTNLSASEDDFNRFITNRFINRKLHKDKYQYTIELEKVLINNNKLKFKIRDESRMMNIHFHQIKKISLSGFINFYKLDIVIKSTKSDSDINISLTPCNLGIFLFNMLDKFIFKSKIP